MTLPGAKFEISIDGKPRSSATQRVIAIEAAEHPSASFRIATSW
jgi:hypothetical protein